MTKREEAFALRIAKELIQEKFTKMFGFAPALKDIIPMEASYEKFHGEWQIQSLAFCVNNIGWNFNELGQVERAEAYDRA